MLKDVCTTIKLVQSEVTFIYIENINTHDIKITIMVRKLNEKKRKLNISTFQASFIVTFLKQKYMKLWRLQKLIIQASLNALFIK